MIFYFSATGNSKYVAESIAKGTNDSTQDIMFYINKDKRNYIVKEGETIALVAPTYAWGLPTVVNEFLQTIKLSYNKKPYFYFVATYGMTPGSAGRFANQYLKEKLGFSFDALFGVKMPDTWTPIFNLSDKKKVEKINCKADIRIDQIIQSVRIGKKGNCMTNRIPGIIRFIHKPCYEQIRHTSNFKVDDICTGCGLCERNCPDKAVILENNKPVWRKEQCIMCLRCLHRCPKFAIHYGNSTRKHGQYMNPHVTF